MSFIMDLPPDVETRLQAEASRQGVPVADVALRLVADNLPPIAPLQEKAEPVLTEKQKAALALLAQWRIEDATDDPEELERREVAIQTLAANLNANRAAEGRPPVFP